MIEPRNELLDVPMTQDRAKMQIRKKGNGVRLGNRWRHEGYVPINGMIRLPCSFMYSMRRSFMFVKMKLYPAEKNEKFPN